MLKRKFRLPIQGWFKEKKKTKSLKSNFFIIKFRKNNLPLSRFGILTRRQVVKNSVGRNKIKRIIFNFIHLNKIQTIHGKDVLIITLMGADKLKKPEIEKEINKLINNGHNF